MFSPERAKADQRSTALRPVGYVGWDGHGNLGDDAIRDALTAALPAVRFVRLPLTGRELAHFVIHARANNVGAMNLLLGGGTVIGRRNWRIPLTVDLALCSRVPALMIGAGVEDPSFQGRHSFSTGGELSKWKHLLNKFDRVTVRGPRSAELLADQGIDSLVVGDPALLFDFPGLPTRSTDGLIGVNLGFGSDLWSHDQPLVVTQVARAIQTLERLHGHRFRFLIINSDDRRWVSQCIDQAGLPAGAYDVCVADSVRDYAEAVRSCSMVVAERLHAGVLAAACTVPVVMLEYQPKCRDFMASIGQEAWIIRTDRLDREPLVEHVLELGRSLSSQRMALGEAVTELRSRLAREVVRLGTRLSAA